MGDALKRAFKAAGSAMSTWGQSGIQWAKNNPRNAIIRGLEIAGLTGVGAVTLSAVSNLGVIFDWRMAAVTLGGLALAGARTMMYAPQTHGFSDFLHSKINQDNLTKAGKFLIVAGVGAWAADQVVDQYSYLLNQTHLLDNARWAHKEAEHMLLRYSVFGSVLATTLCKNIASTVAMNLRSRLAVVGTVALLHPVPKADLSHQSATDATPGSKAADMPACTPALLNSSAFEHCSMQVTTVNGKPVEFTPYTPPNTYGTPITLKDGSTIQIDWVGKGSKGAWIKATLPDVPKHPEGFIPRQQVNAALEANR